MKLAIFSIILFSLTSCSQNKKSYLDEESLLEDRKDTIIVRHQNVLTESFAADFYSKNYSYYSLVGKDTLDLFISAAENKSDSTLHLSIYHKQPVLFLAVLDNLNKCISLIKKDFDLTKLSSISFKSPINYFDLATVLSKEYEQKFNKKRINYQKFHEFLLTSTLNKQLDKFLNPIEKKVKWYSIEKFRYIEKKDFSMYLPGIDFRDYPEFTIDGYTGIYVHVETK